MGESERSEGLHDFNEEARRIVERLLEAALALPPGWKVECQPDGQLRLVPPQAGV